MAEKDVVIGFITGYNFDRLKPWVYSLVESGFEGDKILVCYEINDDVIEQLEKLDFKVIKITPQQRFNIVVHRFYDLWYILQNIQKKYRWVISTDAGDVIFQTNPSEWLQNHMESEKICVGCEGLKYKDEPWGLNNMRLSFGDDIMYKMAERPIYNAGSFAGRHEQVRDLALNVFLSSSGSPLYVPGGGGPDQAALNVILSLEPWRNVTNFTDHKSSWSVQCGTTVDPNQIASFRPNIIDSEPTWDGAFAYNPRGEKYCLVHQYNRVPEWEKVIKKMYE
jgi:hypothetical protein